MQPTARAEEVHVTQRPRVFPARGKWSGRLDSIAGGATSLGGYSKLSHQKSEVMVEDSGQTSCWVTRPGEDQSLRTLPNMAMQTDIWRYGAYPMEHQVVTVPGPQPQRRPPTATVKANKEETPDMTQSSGCLQEALGTSWDTAADCGLRLTHRTEDLAWPETQKKKTDYTRFCMCVCVFCFVI